MGGAVESGRPEAKGPGKPHSIIRAAETQLFETRRSEQASKETL